MASAPPLPTQPRQERNDRELGAVRHSDDIGGGGRGRRRWSLDAQPAARPTREKATAAAAETLAAAGKPQPSSSASPPARCGVCLADFTQYRRPHRCRACGRAVCATCSPARRPKRTCKRCAAGSAAPRVVAAAFPPPPVVAAPYAARAAGAAAPRASRSGAGSRARVLVEAQAPSVEPVAAVAGATHPAVAAGAGGPEEEGTGGPEGPNSPDNSSSSANVSIEGAKASDSVVEGVGEGQRTGGPDLPGDVGGGELEGPTCPAGNGDEEVEGSDRLGGDRAETTVGALENASHVGDTVRSFPDRVLSGNSPTRMGRKSAAAEPDGSGPAGSAASGRDGLPPLSRGAPCSTEEHVVSGPEAATADGDRAVSSETMVGVVVKGGHQREEQGPVLIGGLRLGDGGGEGPVATERGDTDSLGTPATAAQQGSTQGRGGDEDVDVATAAVEELRQAGLDLSTAGRASIAEGRASENTEGPEAISGLLATPHQIGGGEKEEEEVTVVTGVRPILKLKGPFHDASRPVDSETAGGGLSTNNSAVPVSLDREEGTRGQENDSAEKTVGGKKFCDRERGVADKPLVAPALPRDEGAGGGGPQRVAEPPTASPYGFPEGAGNGNSNVGPNITADESAKGEAAALLATAVAPPPAPSHSNPPNTRIEAHHGGAVGRVVLAEGGEDAEDGIAEGDEAAGDWMTALKYLMQNGLSCFH